MLCIKTRFNMLAARRSVFELRAQSKSLNSTRELISLLLLSDSAGSWLAGWLAGECDLHAKRQLLGGEEEEKTGWMTLLGSILGQSFFFLALCVPKRALNQQTTTENERTSERRKTRLPLLHHAWPGLSGVRTPE